MKVSDNSPLGPSYGARRKSGAAATQSSGFEELLGMGESDGASEASATGDVAGIGSMDGMLALQGISEQEAKRRDAIRRGHSMLEALESLRASLLAGRVPAEVMMQLGERLARQRAEVADPKLLEIIDDIEIRVEVEKAKLEKAFADRGIVI